MSGDRPDSFIVVTGNGDIVARCHGPGRPPPSSSAQAWVRLVIQGNGKLDATDFCRAVRRGRAERRGRRRRLGRRRWDCRGSRSGPRAYRTWSVSAGKQGYVYLLEP